MYIRFISVVATLVISGEEDERISRLWHASRHDVSPGQVIGSYDNRRLIKRGWQNPPIGPFCAVDHRGRAIGMYVSAFHRGEIKIPASEKSPQRHLYEPSVILPMPPLGH